jgi:hypothetical protein
MHASLTRNWTLQIHRAFTQGVKGLGGSMLASGTGKVDSGDEGIGVGSSGVYEVQCWLPESGIGRHSI